MRNYSTGLVAGSLLLALSFPAFSQTPTPPATNTVLVPPSKPKIQFASTVYNFQRVSAGTVVKTDFVFTNTGDATLEITSVSPHCGCTTAGDWDKKIEPGKTGKIPLQVNTVAFNGQVTKTAAITCNDPNQPSITLQITGTVWKLIEVIPNVVSFTFPAGKIASESRTVRIVNNQEEPMALSDLKSANPAFRAELKTIEPGKVFEMTVSTVPSAITNTLQAPITAKTSLTNVAGFSVNAVVIVQPAATPPAPAATPAAPTKP